MDDDHYGFSSASLTQIKFIDVSLEHLKYISEMKKHPHKFIQPQFGRNYLLHNNSFNLTEINQFLYRISCFLNNVFRCVQWFEKCSKFNNVLPDIYKFLSVVRLKPGHDSMCRTIHVVMKIRQPVTKMAFKTG